MYEFHSRHTMRNRGAHTPSVPISQTQALDRRHSLDAQQRMYRETAATGHRDTTEPPIAADTNCAGFLPLCDRGNPCVSPDLPQSIILPNEAAAIPPLTTIHEAELAPGPSGAVEYGVEIDEATAVARRRNGKDIVVRGKDGDASRSRAYQIERQVGLPSRPQPPHNRAAGPMALPHFHQQSRSPGGHAFYETPKRKARKKP
jgi:hypothetical protein